MPAIARSTLVRFLLVGGVSYVVNQVLLVAPYDGALASMSRGNAFDVPLLLASMVALEISILVRFALNDIWTFRDRHGKSFAARFYQSNFTSFGTPLICLAAVNVLTPTFGVSYPISNSVGILLSLAWNWFCSIRLVWTADRKSPQSETVAVLPRRRYAVAETPLHENSVLRLLRHPNTPCAACRLAPSSSFLHDVATKLTCYARMISRLMSGFGEQKPLQTRSKKGSSSWLGRQSETTRVGTRTSTP